MFPTPKSGAFLFLSFKTGFLSFKKVKQRNFFAKNMLYNIQKHYICTVFFMVLDLRLTKIGCRETINFFLYLPQRHLSLHKYPL